MEDSDRQKIIVNLPELVKIKGRTQFRTELISRNVFTPEMMENIVPENQITPNKILELFVEIIKRGPEAFSNLVAALAVSGNISQARLLDPNGNFDEVEIGVRQDENDNSGFRSSTKSGPMNSPKTFTPENTYEMSSRPRGFALILNAIDFDGNPNLKRIGADMDSMRLQAQLEQFGYKVDVVINPKKKNLLCKKSGIIKTFTDKFSTQSVDSCVVAVMSHGEDNFWIQTSDCESVHDEHAHLFNLWDDIFPRFNNQHFPMMRNKPKIFIIQSCRGDQIHRRVRVSPVLVTGFGKNGLLKTDFGMREYATDEMFYENHPEYNHMMILQSTIPGYVSLRHEELGSPFIQILCKTLEENGARLTWSELVSEIAKRLQELPAEDGGPQTCTYKTVGYVKSLKFNSYD